MLLQKKLNYPISRVKIANGLSGIAALTDSAGHVFSADDWVGYLSSVGELENEPKEVLKRDGDDSVIVKTLKIGSSNIEAVIKTRGEKFNFIHFLRCGRPACNFKKAVFLKKAGIAAEIPLAALRQKKNAFSEKHIYITEYIPHVATLHWFVKKHLPALSDQAAIKKQIAEQIATLIAALHRNKLWHRDAKPSNFLVHKKNDGKYGLTLIDLDGIKPYCGLETFSRQFRPFVNLAAIRLVSPLVYRTDCLRTFNIYCTLIGLDRAATKKLFRRLIEGPVAKRLETLALIRPEWKRH